MKYLLYQDQVFGTKFHFIVKPESLEQIAKSITIKDFEREKLLEELKESVEMDWEGWSYLYKGHVFIVINQLRGLPTDLNTMVHEIHHAVSFAAEHVGLKKSKDSEEFFAYYEGFLAGFMFPMINF